MPSFRQTVAFMAFLAQVMAVPTFTNAKYEMYKSTPITLKWSDDQTGMVTIRLLTGSSDDLKYELTLTAEGKGGEFTWTPPKDLPAGTYAFEITDESDDDPNYSPSFEYDPEVAPPAGSTKSKESETTTASGSEASFVTTTKSLGNSTMTATTNGTATKTGSTSSEETSAKSTGASSTSSAEDAENTVANLNGESVGGKLGVSALVAAAAGLVGASVFVLA